MRRSRARNPGRFGQRRSTGVLPAVLAAFAASGCATLNESECRSVDWFQLGARDGGAGYSAGRLGEHRKACSEFGLATDDAAWRQGYDAGLLDYCTADNGYRVGRRGDHYAQVCPIEEEREFVAAYELGRETLQVENEFAELNRRIDPLEARLVNDRLEDAQRRDIRRQLSYLYNQRVWLRRSIDRLENEWRRRAYAY